MFWNSSPLKDVANVKTPTLFFAGENDARVPMAQSVEMYPRAEEPTVCRRTLYVAPREGHQWSELRHQLFKANAELEWFEQLRDGPRYVFSGNARRMTRASARSRIAITFPMTMHNSEFGARHVKP